jgi:seryl-tRNA synthetase
LTATLDLTGLEGLGAREAGSVLSGSLLELESRLDRLFVGLAARWRAREYRFPSFIPAESLHRLDYFHSFPHLATFPVALDPHPENLARFSSEGALDGEGAVQLTRTAPIRHVLTPAACYHFYVEFAGERLDAARYVTTRATCHRREERYAPLERQWTFSMRELVCLGSASEVEAFLAEASARVRKLTESIGLRVRVERATDPFFRPANNPKFLFQKVEPVKHEFVFDGRLAIASTNFHRDYFGEAFHIRRGGEATCSGCVAFGLERWLFAFLDTFGPAPADWPELPSWEEIDARG